MTVKAGRWFDLLFHDRNAATNYRIGHINSNYPHRYYIIASRAQFEIIPRILLHTPESKINPELTNRSHFLISEENNVETDPLGAQHNKKNGER